MNFCINCVSYSGHAIDGKALCLHPRNVSPVDGVVGLEKCEFARSKKGFCGPEGRHFSVHALHIPDMPAAEILAK